MKTNKILLIIIGILFCTCIQAQVSYSTNDPTANPTPLGYLGWNDSQNKRLDILQNNTLRMRFKKYNWYGYNGSGPVYNASRVFMGIQGNSMVDPFSILQLGYNIDYYLRRSWMNVGITYGAGADFMHTGLLVHPVGALNNKTVDAVVAWGDNDDFYQPFNGPDNLRFLFISPVDEIDSPGSVREGLETMRTTSRGNVGIGDFSHMANGIGGSYGQPRARLDVQLRNKLRSYTENAAAIFVNDAFTHTGYVQLKRGIISTVNNSENEAIVRAVAGDFFAQKAKINTAVQAGATGIGGVSIGVDAFAENFDGDSKHFGVIGSARGAVDNVGVQGTGNSSDDGFAAGIEGISGTASNEWGGYFSGKTYCSLGYWSASDENIKEDITEIENATETLLALQPKHYTFNQNIPQLVLDNQYHFGFLAQDMESVVPELVRDMITPTQIDSSGNVILESAQFKAVQYDGIIPILVAGFQEQNAALSSQAYTIAAQNEQIVNLETQLKTQATQLKEMQNQIADMTHAVQTMQAKTANCCDCPTKGETGSKPSGSADEIKLGQNIPNPFDQKTRIEFSIPAPASVILEITDASGRPLERLINAPMTKGNHSAIWDGSGFAPGIYFYSLYADGQLLTRKMIKH